MKAMAGSDADDTVETKKMIVAYIQDQYKVKGATMKEIKENPFKIKMKAHKDPCLVAKIVVQRCVFEMVPEQILEEVIISEEKQFKVHDVRVRKDLGETQSNIVLLPMKPIPLSSPIENSISSPSLSLSPSPSPNVNGMIEPGADKAMNKVHAVPVPLIKVKRKNKIPTAKDVLNRPQV
jgi:hypothetical protein